MGYVSLAFSGAILVGPFYYFLKNWFLFLFESDSCFRDLKKVWLKYMLETFHMNTRHLKRLYLMFCMIQAFIISLGRKSLKDFKIIYTISVLQWSTLPISDINFNGISFFSCAQVKNFWSFFTNWNYLFICTFCDTLLTLLRSFSAF